MMKGQQYDRRFLERGIRPQVRAIRESNGIDEALVSYVCGGDTTLEKDFRTLLEDMQDARIYGSLITVRFQDWNRLFARLDDLEENVLAQKQQVETRLRPLMEAAQMLSQTYDVVITNPPYLGSSRFPELLSKFVKTHYADEKNDLSMAMYRRAIDCFVKTNGMVAFITTSSWMFLSGFEKMRDYLLKNVTLCNLVDFGTELFEGKVGHNPIASWVVWRRNIPGHSMTGIRLVEFCYSRRNEKVSQFFNCQNRYVIKQENFKKFPGAPIAYWASQSILNSFSNGELLEDIGHPKKGLATTDNKRFLRMWHEVGINKFAVGCKDKESGIVIHKKWFPLNKGGEYRKWYGNKTYAVNWENDGAEMKRAVIDRYKGGSYTKEIRSENKYFKDCITWSALTAGLPSFRYSDYGALFDSAGSSMFPEENLFYILGLLNTKIVNNILQIINPTLNYGAGSIANIPVLLADNATQEHVEKLAQENISISKEDWDSFETSWDFPRHPMAGGFDTVEAGYWVWQSACEDRFTRLRANEEELNRLFIGIYGLEGELTPDVAEKDVTVARIFDSKEDIPEAMKGSAYALTKEDAVKSLLSYAVGCLFGRYSLDAPGLVYAGGDWDEAKYRSVTPAADGLIPVLDEDYRADDLMGRFLGWLDAAYGPAHREENLAFIASALGGKGSPREVIRRYFFDDFFADHCRTYRKRPIYWLFDSGKKGGFRALMYLHRYHPDTAARLRTAYVHPLQQQYRAAMEETARHITPDTPAVEKMRLTKRLARLREKDEELHRYEEKIHHLADERVALDLDDGVKVNYAKLQDVLAKIR